MTRYGYIGLGAMGAAMVERLLSAGAAVTCFDIDQAAIDRCVGLGAVSAVSAAEVAGSSEIVSICVPAAAHIEAVLTGPDGVGAGARSGSTLLVHSTVHPNTVLAAQSAAASWGAELHDACVAGGEGAARAGELAVFLGGGAAASPQVLELLSIYGSKVIDAGPVGSGAALKIGVNVMTYAQQAAARNAFELVESAGGSTDALVAAWKHIGQLGKLTELFLGLLSIPPEHISGDFRESLLRSVDIGQKDLGLAMELTAANGPFPDVLASLQRAMPAILGVADPVPGANGAPSPDESRNP